MEKTNAMYEAIVNDSNVMAALQNAANAQEVSDILAEKGVHISPAQVDTFMDQFLGEGELNEDQLDMVAGGGFKLRYLNPIYWIGRLIAWAVTDDMC